MRTGSLRLRLKQENLFFTSTKDDSFKTREFHLESYIAMGRVEMAIN